MTYRPLAGLARDLRSRRLTSAALTGQAIGRFDATEQLLQAYKTWAGEQAGRHALVADTLFDSGYDLGPLMGIPVSVKDLYGVPNLPVFAGTDTEFPREWQNPGPVVQSVIRQLGIIMGKTHTVEFAFGGLGTNAHWGAPVNPWSAKDAPRVSGGSSSGAGVSLAQGSALVALGTDTAGSVRIPASFTGQTALKTTLGRWPANGIVPLSPSLDTPGLLCRTVEDLAFGFAALDGASSAVAAPPGLAGLRIGVVQNVVWDDIDASIAENTRAAIATLEQKGAVLSTMTLPGVEEALEIFRLGGLAASELRSFLDQNFPERIARLDPSVRMRVEGADQISSTEYLRRRSVLTRCGQEALAAFGDFDVLATPTVPVSAPLVSELGDAGTYRRANMLALRNTAIANLFGWCAITLPTGLDANGIPTGLQLLAPPMQEERLLAAGLAVEAAIGRGPELLGQPEF